MLRINDRVRLDESELRFRYSRSPGPGGQNVNKVNTRVTLLFDVAGSPSLTRAQKQRILRKLSTRSTKQGILRVVCSRHRTQVANRRAAIEKLVQLLAEALRQRKSRKKTTVPAWSREKRLREKKMRSQLKQQRNRPDLD